MRRVAVFPWTKCQREMLLNCSWLLCETLLAKKKHWCRVPKPLGVGNILAENWEIQRVKKIISGKREAGKDREDLIKIHIKSNVVQFTNSIPNCVSWRIVSILIFSPFVWKRQWKENKIAAYDKAEKIQDHCTCSRVKDSYLILQFRWSVTVIWQPYFKKIGKIVEQDGLNSFLCYLKLLNLFQISYHGEFLCLQIWRGCTFCLLNFLAWPNERWGSYQPNTLCLLE